jgi:hypothetical protein
MKSNIRASATANSWAPAGSSLETISAVADCTCAAVTVAGRTVSGYVTFETRAGLSTDTPDDPTVVKFIAYQYGKNADALPAGAHRPNCPEGCRNAGTPGHRAEVTR